MPTSEAARAGRAAIRDRLLAAVDTISATLAAQVEDEERAGELSRISSDALYAHGILQMKLPAVLGGAEADLVTQFEVLEALAMINPAAAWCAMVGASSLALSGAFLPDEGILKMFPDGQVPRGAALISPSGTATPVDGGYRLSGRWGFASGVRHADWVAAFALVHEAAAGGPAVHMLVFPIEEVTVHDNWQVVGLRGTGSCDISVDDIFVPAAMAWNFHTQAPRRGGAFYHLGVPALVAYEHAAFALGVARRALEALTTLAIAKKRGYGPGAATLADRAAVQRFIGHSSLRVGAARALAIELNHRAMATVDADRSIDVTLAIELRGSASYATEVACEVVTQAFRYAGASAIFESSVMQRCLRDINVAAQHLMVSEVTYELLGKAQLGFADVKAMG